MTQIHPVKPFLDVLSGHRQPVPPIWMMRQAGRYLPEYRELRAKAGGFLDLCFTPEYAAEVTLQPIRRFNFDAAIIFSDILVIPYALGRSVRFEAGEGPRLDPLDTPEKVKTLASEADFTRLEPVYEALRRVRGALDPKIALIGFCGAPWTVATYMVAGQGTPDQAPARMMAYRHPEAFARIIDVLVENSIRYLLGQLKAGADVLQIFDTWAGVLPPREFERWSIEPTRRIVEGVRKQVPDARIIGFPRGAGALLPAYVGATGVDAVSIDWTAEPSLIRERVQNRVAIQGNLDPPAISASGSRDRRRIGELRRRPADLQPRPRHPAGNPDRACRADDQAGAGVSGLGAAGRSRHTRESGYPVIAGLRWNRNVTEYWIIRWSLSSGGHSADPLADDDDSIRGSVVDQSPRPAAFDDLGRALVQELEPDRAAEFARTVRGPGARRLDEPAARFVQHRGGQCHLRARDG